jgi:prepilin-type N-terminal cleavage/methylation domain-containing protein
VAAFAGAGMFPKHRGFTLVELLVVIAIVGVLVALVVPAVQQARETARQTSCRNNLKQIGLALHNYHSGHGLLPPSSTSDVEQGGWIVVPQSRHIHSWLSLVLPYLDQANLHDQIDFDLSSMSPVNLLVAEQLPAMYRCPSYTGASFSTDENYTRFSERCAITNYAAMGSTDVGHMYGQNSRLLAPNGTMYPLSSTRLGNLIDGASNTILVCETREEKMMVWTDGGTAALVSRPYDPGNPPTYGARRNSLNYRPYFSYDNPSAEYGPSSMHPGGAVHLLADGAVRFISENISERLYAALATPNGRESIGDF